MVIYILRRVAKKQYGIGNINTWLQQQHEKFDRYRSFGWCELSYFSYIFIIRATQYLFIILKSGFEFVEVALLSHAELNQVPNSFFLLRQSHDSSRLQFYGGKYRNGCLFGYIKKKKRWTGVEE